MSHELTLLANGAAEMAYIGERPWHGYGQLLQPGATIEEWRHGAHLNWEILRTPVQYQTDELRGWPKQEVLFRSDTKAPLAVVTPRYQIVQPGEVLEFFRDLVEAQGFELETAGTMKGGKVIWALARTNLDGEVVSGDDLKTYLLLVTSCDGGLATTAMFTSIRVVCNNTMHMAFESFDTNVGKIKVRHNTAFDPRVVKERLGLNASAVFGDFMGRMKGLAETSLSGFMAQQLIEQLLEKSGTTGGTKGIRETKGFKSIVGLFNGSGAGARMDGVAGTSWGLLNAVTEYVDHHSRSQNADNRLNSAWFGEGAKMKAAALELLENF